MQAFADLFANFGVTWTRLGAQLLTFVVLLFFLKLVLYKPMLQMLEDRKQRIAQGLADAETAAKARTASEAEATERLKEATRKAEALLRESKEAADRLKRELMAQTQEELTKLRQNNEAEMARAKEEMLAQVRQEVVHLVVATTSKVLQQALTKEELQKVTTLATKELQS